MEKELGIKGVVIDCLIRMYPSLKEWNYRHVITVCTGERCRRREDYKSGIFEY